MQNKKKIEKKMKVNVDRERGKETERERGIMR